VATVGFPDIGLQGFKNTNDEGRMKNEETKQQPARADWQFFIHPSSFCIFPCWPIRPRRRRSCPCLLISIAAREHKEHRDSLRSLCSFVVNQSAQDAAVLVLVY
jgi:hypothetical protein